MKLKVKLFGTLRSHYPGYKHTSGVELESDSELSVRQTIEKLGFPAKLVGIVTINGKLAKAQDFIPDNAELKIFQPLTGG